MDTRIASEYNYVKSGMEDLIASEYNYVKSGVEDLLAVAVEIVQYLEAVIDERDSTISDLEAQVMELQMGIDSQS